MNFKNISIIAIVTLLTFSINACKDDEETVTPEPTAVTFDISDPVAGTMYGKGDTVFINGMISYDVEMHGYEINIINTSNNDTVVFNKHAHSDSKMFHIHEHWVNNVSGHSNMTLSIEALTDHSGASQTKEISFHCHPM